MLGLEREAWTLADILRVMRRAGGDANWSVWLSILPLRDREDWPELWTQIVNAGSDSVVSFDGLEFDDLNEILGGFDYVGSNALAVAGWRSKTGTALLAGDPHLPYVLPNVWLLAGV